MQNANQGRLTDHSENLRGHAIRIGIVQARFNFDVTQALAQACTQELIRLGVENDNIELVTVPGALEIPIALQAMADSDQFDALVALGCVIRGETYHFELVANESASAITRLTLDYQIPIANVILTTENHEQAVARQTEKGRDAAQVAVEMANLLTRMT